MSVKAISNGRKKYYAHTKTNPDGTPAPQSDWQPLKDHLQNVATLARKFAEDARPGGGKGGGHKECYEKHYQS